MYRDIENLLDDFYKLYYKIEKLNTYNSIKCLTANEMRIISNIDDAKLTINDLSNRLETTLGTTSAAVSKLEQKQFVYRKKDKEDKRKVYIMLTKKGNIVKDFQSNFSKSLLGQITKNIESKDIMTFEKVLRKLNSNLYIIKEKLEPVKLTSLKVNTICIIDEIKASDVLLKYLIEKGFTLGKEIKIIEKDKKTITLIIDNKEKIINVEDAMNIMCIKKEQ